MADIIIIVSKTVLQNVLPDTFFCVKEETKWNNGQLLPFSFAK